MKSGDEDARRQCQQELISIIAPRFFAFALAMAASGHGRLASGKPLPLGLGRGSFSIVALCLLGAHVLGTVVPLVGFLAKCLPPNPIPWHYQVKQRKNSMSQVGKNNTARWLTLYFSSLPLCSKIVQHIAHRYGEFTMLMLGESILSGILAPVHNRSRYFISLGLSLLLVQTLQLVHFNSEE